MPALRFFKLVSPAAIRSPNLAIASFVLLSAEFSLANFSAASFAAAACAFSASVRGPNAAAAARIAMFHSSDSVVMIFLPISNCIFMVKK